MNPLYELVEEGTVGELIVQLRLLEHGIQAAPPLRDSGNDLIAIRGEAFRAIQVKTTYRDRFTKLGDLSMKRYHILALVVERDSLLLDRSEIYLLSKDAVTKSSYSVEVPGSPSRSPLKEVHAEFCLQARAFLSSVVMRESVPAS